MVAKMADKVGLLLTFCLLLLPLWESVTVLCFVIRYFYVHSSIAIILMGKRELIALLKLSSWSLVMVERLFPAAPWGCLQFVIVVFPDHTHLLFLKKRNRHIRPNLRFFETVFFKNLILVQANTKKPF